MNNLEMTLEELTREAERILRQRGLAVEGDDHRVTEVPDPRTIRYYTTIGLLDRPVISGKQARYTMRHLLQLLAIKALQRTGFSLARIQQRLYGRNESELEALFNSIVVEEREPDIVPVTWLEVVLLPGLKLMADESWIPPSDMAVLEKRFNAAVAALIKTPRGSERSSQ
jgi:DNA-binding transcriptional MerR regulator